MKEFNLGSFASHLAVMELAARRQMEAGLKHVAKTIEQTAKEELGTYQPEVGPFGEWPSLADSTQVDRVRKGFTADDPGLRSGEMRESIEHTVIGLEAEIGSNDQNLVYFEMGTTKQPPRPVLGPAVVHNEHGIKEILGKAVVAGFLAEQYVPGVLTAKKV